jgi:hypothetical protein
MLPWGHLAIGYVTYSLVERVGRGRAPGGAAVLWLAVGTQFPDLIDKPLAWWFGIIPSGRMVAHSLLIGLPVIAVAIWYAHRYDRTRDGFAFAIGYITHLLGDSIGLLLGGAYWRARFLVWPLVPPVDYETERSVLVHLADVNPSALLLVAPLVLLWIYDERPGLTELRAIPSLVGSAYSPDEDSN